MSSSQTSTKPDTFTAKKKYEQHKNSAKHEKSFREKRKEK